MANKLAGLRAKFTKALADYDKIDDEEETGRGSTHG